MAKTPREISVETFVDNGKLLKNRDLIEEAISQYEGKEITITLKRYYKKRSNNQNSYYWAVIVPHWKNILLEEWGEVLTHDQVHEFLKANLSYEEFYDGETGEILMNEITNLPIRKLKSTTKNTTFSQEEYHEACRQLAYNMFDAQIPLPDAKLKARFT